MLAEIGLICIETADLNLPRSLGRRNVNWMFWTEIKYNLVNSYFVCVAEVLLQQNGNGGNVQTLLHYHIQKHFIKPTHICKLKYVEQ